MEKLLLGWAVRVEASTGKKGGVWVAVDAKVPFFVR